ncbi:MAG: hypothetical protein BM564_00285 [Bacteroidetes bacterium MedPE-SWsnd-G2]|nr:MAG: hypothetical protein BM564_00285 [Bacteroidetes bacterium MedPE-SWsnd-G2]
MNRNYLAVALLMFVCNSWGQQYKQMIASGTYTVEEIREEAQIYFETFGTERGKGYKPYKRWEYMALRTMNEDGMLESPEFYLNALEDYNNYQNNEIGFAERTTVGTWTEHGPESWNATSGWNPGVGRITSIAFDSEDSNHLIVGANTGGVWKSLNGGSSWEVLTDNLSNLVVSSLAIDPSDSQTYFWGANSGVIFKSTDAGATWNVLADVGSGSVNKILIHPTNSNTMFCSAQNGGLFKSFDGGETWETIHASASDGYDIEFKAGDPSIVFATGASFFMSLDGGLTFNTPQSLSNWDRDYVSGNTDWSVSSSNQNGTISPYAGTSMGWYYIGNFSQPTTRLVSAEIDLTGATNPTLNFAHAQVQWAGDIDELRVLYKTSENGSWTELANYTDEVTVWNYESIALPDANSTYYIAFEATSNYGRGVNIDEITIDDPTLGTVFSEDFENASSDSFGSGPKMIGVSIADPEIIYVLEAQGGLFGGLHKSLDGGMTFEKLDHGSNNYFGYSSNADDTSGQAPRDMDIAIDPTDINEVHIAGVNTWKSSNGGASFTISSQWTPNNANSQNIGYCHADVDILIFNDNKLFVGSDGGIFVANTPDFLNSNYYTDLTQGLGIRQFYKIGISQSDPVVVTGGSQDNGTSIMDGSGDWTDWLGADGMETFVDKTNTSTIYGMVQFGGMYKSTNSGAYSYGIGSPDGKSGNWVTPFEQDPTAVNTIYVGYDEVYKSTNGGNGWTSISQNFGGNLNHLKIANSNSSVMYAAIGGSLYKTTNGGITNWTQINTGISGSINSIAIHPNDPNKVAVATTSADKVYVSSNGGLTWLPYTYDLPNFSALAVVWHDNGSNGLYVGMNYGVYYTDDNNTNTWLEFSNNLPNVIINELEINTVNNKIYAATYGRGLWSSDLYSTTLGVDDLVFEGLNMYPNPANNELNFNWNKSDDVTIKIYDQLGKLMYFTKSQNLQNGFRADISNLSTGLYIVRLNTVTGFVTKKLIVR